MSLREPPNSGYLGDPTETGAADEYTKSYNEMFRSFIENIRRDMRHATKNLSSDAALEELIEMHSLPYDQPASGSF